MNHYIHQLPDWPHFQWGDKTLLSRLADVRHRQGRLSGRMEGLGFAHLAAHWVSFHQYIWRRFEGPMRRAPLTIEELRAMAFRDDRFLET